MKKFSVSTTYVALLLLTALPFAPVQADDVDDDRAYRWGWRGEAPNLVERLERNGNFETLLALLDATGLKDTVATAEALTLYAPTDGAFGDVPPELLEFLGNNPDVLTDVLLYHVTPGAKRLGELIYAGTADTLLGQPVLFTFEAFRFFVNDSRILRANVRASNGYIHVIDAVMLPPDEEIEIACTTDVLRLDGRFETLLFALESTGLDEALCADELTLFAPTDDAFANLPEGALEALVADPDALAQVLLYHVVPGSRGAIQLLIEGSVETLQGDDVHVRFRRGGLFVNSSRVINPNVQSPTGQFHVLDAVLLPPGD